MSNPLNNLLETRQQLVAQIAELNKTLKAVDEQLFSRIQKLAEAFEGSLAPDVPVAQKNLFKIQPRIPGSNGKKHAHGSSLLEPVVNILRSSGPLTTRELYAELIKRNVPIGGKRPKANLSAHITHMQVVEKTAKGWALKANSH